MPISIISDTREMLGDDARQCASRSLFNDRFADPQAKEDARKRWFGDLLKKNAEKVVRTDWLPANAAQLHARLMSRLMVDLSGGVMENANVLLDRYGLPYIPGSAVKGCARRMALQALHDWISSQNTPGSEERPAEDDACAPCCFEDTDKPFATPAHMLAAIARVFGWVETDWDAGKKDGRWKSDFAWACAATSSAPTGQIIPAQGSALGNANPTEPSPEGAAQQVRSLFTTARALLPSHKTFAGTIAFLPASPNADPGLELDVVTPHHTKYYQGELETATDTEDPIPVYFPAVKPQGGSDYFTFPLIPLRLAKKGDLDFAKRWLAYGLELFGLGAKTAAGYGWFDASDELNQQIKKRISNHIQAAKEEAQRKADAEKAAQEAEAQRKAKAELAASLEGLTPEQQEDKKLELLNDAQFDNKVRNFWKETKRGGPSEPEKAAIVRALRGPRLAYWQDFKTKATKGDLATAANAIRTLNKQLNGDKMP